MMERKRRSENKIRRPKGSMKCMLISRFRRPLASKKRKLSKCICKKTRWGWTAKIPYLGEISDGIFGCGKKEKQGSKPDDQKKKEDPKAKTTGPCSPPHSNQTSPPTPTSAPACPSPTVKHSKGCKHTEPSKRSKRNKRFKGPPRSRNPFLIFFLTMHRKCPEKPMKVLAKEAGPLWCAMSDEEKEVYRKQARQEQNRQRKKCKGKKKMMKRSSHKCPSRRIKKKKRSMRKRCR